MKRHDSRLSWTFSNANVCPILRLQPQVPRVSSFVVVSCLPQKRHCEEAPPPVIARIWYLYLITEIIAISTCVESTYEVVVSWILDRVGRHIDVPCTSCRYNCEQGAHKTRLIVRHRLFVRCDVGPFHLCHCCDGASSTYHIGINACSS